MSADLPYYNFQTVPYTYSKSSIFVKTNGDKAVAIQRMHGKLQGVKDDCLLVFTSDSEFLRQARRACRVTQKKTAQLCLPPAQYDDKPVTV